MICRGFLIVCLTGASFAQGIPPVVVENFQASQKVADSDFQQGQKALDARQWDKAVAFFDASVAHKSAPVDAALYWKAYAENRAGREEAALSSLAELRNVSPASHWIKDAAALEVEVRAHAGAPVNPNAESDEDLKLLAINSLMQSDPNTALPILEKVLASNNSLKVKDRALFVLTQSNSPEAHKALLEAARNSSRRELQMKAVRYMGMMGNDESRKELASLYASSSDQELKREILKGFMISGSRPLLANIAKNEKDPELRREAIRELALCGGQAELWTIYQSSGSLEDKKAILKSMFVSGDSSKLMEVAQTEKEPELKAEAIKSLGLMGHNGDTANLAAIYRSDPNPEVRKAVLNSLFLQGNGAGLVELARAEKDPAMKEEIVKKIALVHTKETTDYLMDILK